MRGLVRFLIGWEFEGLAQVFDYSLKVRDGSNNSKVHSLGIASITSAAMLFLVRRVFRLLTCVYLYFLSLSVIGSGRSAVIFPGRLITARHHK